VLALLRHERSAPRRHRRKMLFGQPHTVVVFFESVAASAHSRERHCGGRAPAGRLASADIFRTIGRCHYCSLSAFGLIPQSRNDIATP
jgi:hypothetical protein